MASDIELVLNKLQGLADQFMYSTTQRRVQLSREKEARVGEAYQYLIGQEQDQIGEYEATIDSIQQNLLDRGVELKSVKNEHQTVASEELLTAANEGALTMLNTMLNDTRNRKESFENYQREAIKVKRHIDLFDEAIQLVDPAATGEPHLVEASDVATAASDFITAYDKYEPEIAQRLTYLQTEGQLERLQEDYYARLKSEADQKILAATAGQTSAKIKIETLEPIKKEAQEAVKAMTYQPISKMVEQYGVIISRQAEIDTGDLSTSEANTAEEEILQQQTRLGTLLFPWSYSADQAAVEAQNMQTAITKAVKNGDYYDLIDYFKKGNAQYKIMMQRGDPLAETYRSDVQSMFGIDISSDNWVSQLVELNEISARIDIEQAAEAVKIGKAILPEVPSGEEEEVDILLQQFLQGSLSE